MSFKRKPYPNMLISVSIILTFLFQTLLYAQIETDKYLWLEEIHGKKQLEWVEEHNRKAVDYLSKIDGYDECFRFSYKINTSDDQLAYPIIHGNCIYNFWQDDVHPRGILRRTSRENYLAGTSDWELVLDMDSLSASDSIDWVLSGLYFAPRNSKRCIIRLSEGGSDAALLKEFDLVLKQFIPDGFNVGSAKSDVEWIDEDHVYIASNFGEGTLTSSGYSRIVKRWERGTPIEDAELVFEGSADDMAVYPFVSHTDSSDHQIIVQCHDFYRYKLFYVSDTGLIQLALPENIYYEIFGDFLIIRLSGEWITDTGILNKGTVLALKIDDLCRGIVRYEKLFEVENAKAVNKMHVSKDCLLLNIMNNIKSEVIACRNIDGKWILSRVNVPSGGSLEIIAINRYNPEYYLTFESYTQPPTLYIDYSNGSDPVALMSAPSYYDGSVCVVDQFEAVSADGTQIPYFVLHRKDMVANGSNPLILYGYGGFDVSETPNYSPVYGKLWVEEGGVFVVANIRGGGEFGPEWHLSAIKQNKQRSYDDFIAVAEDLIRRKITSPRNIGIIGGSNGGLLVGAVTMQRPDLFGAVVSRAPLLDMKRYSKLLAGKSWIAEYGDPDIPEEWDYIKKYSPYHNIIQGIAYPPVLFLTSTSDDRVHPGHARKMSAKLEEAGALVYLYENTEGGHYVSYTPENIAKIHAMTVSFFRDQLKSKHRSLPGVK